jgi:DNA-binding PadR family transcriptional regulator
VLLEAESAAAMPHWSPAFDSIDRGTLILISLAGGDRHGYGVINDVAQFAGVTLAQTTVYSALARLETGGAIEQLASNHRRRTYRLTDAGARLLHAHLHEMLRLAETGLTRLRP